MSIERATNGLWSIGHSNHTEEKFVDLLKDADIDVVADVRTVPAVSYSTHFSQQPLRRILKRAKIGYVFLGSELGGRPRGDEFYDEKSHVDYDVFAESATFRAGLKRLLDGAVSHRVAMMCSEGAPEECHRHLLIARVLDLEGIPVIHLLPDGSSQSAATILKAKQPRPRLFGQDVQPWKSIRPVLRNAPPRSSSTF